MRLGILGAMREEVEGLVAGRLFGRDVVVVFSRWGKVAAAATATHLLVEHGVTALLGEG